MDAQTLVQTLEASLDPSKNKQAETTLLREQKQSAFPLALLEVIATPASGPTARLAGALYFKNFIRKNWTDEDGNYKLPQNVVATIKSEIIGLMISVPPNIQYQLGDAIGVIADSDFWERWDTLVDDLASRMSPDNPTTNIGVLQVAHSIFKRWRPLYQSDALFTEINHVLSKFSSPFLTLLQSTDSKIQQNENNAQPLHQHFACLNLLMKLFYDLSVQDMPPLFEEHLSGLALLMLKYLTYDNSLLHTDSDSESGLLELVKSEIFEALGLYVLKYNEEFDQHIEQFIGSSWTFLTTVGIETKYDILVSKALKFLTEVTRIPKHARAFSNQKTLSQVVERVIIPNLTLRESDIELFEDEPIEFIRRDLEGSDSETRRRAATDFLRQLLTQFPDTVNQVVSRYITHYLSEYSQDPKSNWKSKDTALYLYSSIAAKGTITASQGVVSIYEFADIIDFFQRNVAADLTSDDPIEPILKVDAIKYLYIFRSQISSTQWRDAFPLVIKHLGSSNYVVYTYAAIALERVMALSDSTKQPVIRAADVQSLSAQLLQHLFQLIEQSAGPAKMQENEFLMRCVMRLIIVIRDGVVPLTDILLTHLANITDIISQNPSNPKFYYYHFEALGAFIRFGAPSQAQKLESGLFPMLAKVLQNDIQEFVPYAFQLLAALLEANPSGSLSEHYQTLLQPNGILNPGLWAIKGNIPALVRLLSAIIPRGASSVITNEQLQAMLGIFQQLVAMKANEAYGFELLESIITSFPPSALSEYWVNIFQILLTRLHSSKTEAFALKFVKLYHTISAQGDRGLGSDFFINIVEQIQSGIFVQLYLTVILPDTQKLLRPLDRKVAVISLTKTLTDSAAFADKYKKGWAYSCEAVFKLLENPPIPPKADDVIAEQDVDDMSFGVGFTQLATVKRPSKDEWPEIRDAKKWVGEWLRASDARLQGTVATFAGERLSDDGKAVFAQYTAVY